MAVVTKPENKQILNSTETVKIAGCDGETLRSLFRGKKHSPVVAAKLTALCLFSTSLWSGRTEMDQSAIVRLDQTTSLMTKILKMKYRKSQASHLETLKFHHKNSWLSVCNWSSCGAPHLSFSENCARTHGKPPTVGYFHHLRLHTHTQ